MAMERGARPATSKACPAGGSDAPAGTGAGLVPVVGLGGSAGAIPALQEFFRSVPGHGGLAYVVLVHLPVGSDSHLAELLQRCTPMQVTMLRGHHRIESERVYVAPPGYTVRVDGGHVGVEPFEARQQRPSLVSVDLFLRSLADSHGAHAAAIILSGADADGAMGIKRIKEHGGLTIAQDPLQSEQPAMPQAAIDTGLVDWVLPVAQMGPRITSYFQLETSLRVPRELEQPPAPPQNDALASEDGLLRDVLSFVRSRTGRDFAVYKRATVVRRITRRMQVNRTETLADYLEALRTRPGEAKALVQDLLISVTNFFRDPECFDALIPQIDRVLAQRAAEDAVRVWVPGCATGEEAYTLAMLLAERAGELDAGVLVQVFATDLDEDTIRVAREGFYPTAIEADVSAQRLRRFFTAEHGGYRVRRELRESVLFAPHDVLRDSPFSRLDLVSCRNLLIYLNRDAQQRLFRTFHFALKPHGLLLLGTSESVDEGSDLFEVVDKKHRIYRQRPGKPALLLDSLDAGSPDRLLAGASLHARIDRHWPVLPGPVFDRPALQLPMSQEPGTRSSWAELHYRVLETLGPPSLLVGRDEEILHISPTAGRFLQMGGGEPTRSLGRCVLPDLRLNLRAALHEAAQGGGPVELPPHPLDVGGERMQVGVRVLPAAQGTADVFVVQFLAGSPQAPPPPGAAAPPQAPADLRVQHLDRELERLRTRLRDTVEEYEASTEELKASNEELKAMNEELRSAAEELETGREELQSINEELSTVNLELKNKVNDLAMANSDIHNLMDATEIATVFLDREMRVVRYTPAAVQLFNLIPTDVGRKLSDLASRLNYPELAQDAATVLSSLQRTEREVGQPDGRWFVARLLPYRTMDDRISGVVVSFIDITERKRAEEVRMWLSTVVESSSDGIVSFALDGTILSWNAGAHQVFGHTPQAAIGEPLAFLATSPEHEAELRRQLQQIVAGSTLRFDTSWRHQDARAVAVSISIAPIRDGDGRVIGGTAVARDMTQARAAQEALERSRQELKEALAVAEEVRAQLEVDDAAKDRFLAVLSHELRNPLAAIRNSAEILSRPVANVRVQHAVDVLRRQSASMKLLLDDLLDVSRLRLGRLEIRPQKVKLADLVARAVEATSGAIESGGHELTLALPPGDVELEADPVRAAQILGNLIGNAARYTTRAGHIDVSARVDGGEVVIDVKDDGMGIEPGRIESMFKMFTQANPSAGPSTEGLGIGLSLARSLAELHGGRIEAISGGQGQGSTFTVRLPLRSAKAERAAGPPQGE